MEKGCNNGGLAYTSSRGCFNSLNPWPVGLNPSTLTCLFLITRWQLYTLHIFYCITDLLHNFHQLHTSITCKRAVLSTHSLKHLEWIRTNNRNKPTSGQLLQIVQSFRPHRPLNQMPTGSFWAIAVSVGSGIAAAGSSDSSAHTAADFSVEN